MDRWQNNIDQALAFQANGQFPQAERMFEAARRIADAVGRHELAGQARAMLGHCLALQGRHEDALKPLGPAYEFFAGALADATTPPELQLRYAHEMWRIGSYFVDIGLLDESEAALSAAHDTFALQLSPQAIELARCRLDLARLADARGLTEEASEHYREAVTIYRVQPEQVLATEIGFGRALQGFGTCLHELGRPVEAEVVLREAYSSLQRLLGSDDPALGWLLHSMGLVQQTLGRLDRAEAFFSRSISLAEAGASPDYLAAASRMAQLAELYRFSGRHADAEDLLERALDATIRVYGQNHEAVAEVLQQMVEMYWDRGELSAAVDACRESLAIRRAAVGHNDPSVAITLNQLASIYFEMGRCDEAEGPARGSYEIFHAIEPGSEATATALNLMGQVAAGLGRHADAEKYLVESISLMTKAAGEADPRVITSVNNLVPVCASLRKPEQAERALRWALKATAPELGMGHPQVAQAVGSLADLLRQTGRQAEAQAVISWAESLG